MKNGDRRKSGRGAVATGAAAVGAVSFGTILLGAAAFGAVAVGALAIRRLSVRHAKLRRVEIDDLAVGRLTLGRDARTITLRIRAEPGKGEALERLIADEAKALAPRGTLLAHRSEIDRDLFLLQASMCGAGKDTRDGHISVFDALFREATANGFIAASSDELVGLEVFRSI